MVKERPSCFAARLTTRLAAVALAALAAPTKLDEIRFCLLCLRFP